MSKSPAHSVITNSVCANVNEGGDFDDQSGILSPVFDQNGYVVHDNIATGYVVTGHASGDWMRLYLLDAPEGSSLRNLAIAIVAPESTFDRAVEAAAPVVNSIEFHAPQRRRTGQKKSPG